MTSAAPHVDAKRIALSKGAVEKKKPRGETEKRNSTKKR